MPEGLCLIGGSGFLGSEVYSALRKLPDFAGVPIAIVDPSRPPFKLTGRRDVALPPDDAGLAHALSGFDICVNLAAKVFAEAEGAPAQIGELLFAAMQPNHTSLPVLQASLTTWIQVSSISVYARHPDGAPLTEQHPTDPASPYGVAKLATEVYLRTYFEARDLVLQCLRFGDLYGPVSPAARDARLLPVLLRSLRDGVPFIRFGASEARRELLHVRDAARATAMSVASLRGGVWNVAADEKATLNGLIECVGAWTSRPLRLNENPEARVMDLILCGRAFADAYGFRPEVSLEDGIAEAVAVVVEG